MEGGREPACHCEIVGWNTRVNCSSSPHCVEWWPVTQTDRRGRTDQHGAPLTQKELNKQYNTALQQRQDTHWETQTKGRKKGRQATLLCFFCACVQLHIMCVYECDGCFELEVVALYSRLMRWEFGFLSFFLHGDVCVTASRDFVAGQITALRCLKGASFFSAI